jgi:hypothetical protein
MREEMKTDKDEMLAKMDANQEMTARMQDELISTIKIFKFNGEETTACLEETEARLEVEGKPASVVTTPEVAHEQEVPREDAEEMPVGEPRKRRQDGRNLAAERRQKKEQKRTQRKDGCRNNLAAARRGTTRRATVARRRRNILRKILTHGFCGLRKEVTAAGMRITRCAGHRRTGRNKDDVERLTPTLYNMFTLITSSNDLQSNTGTTEMYLTHF